MRFSTIAALCAAPLAMASMLEAEVVPRSLKARGGDKSDGGKSEGGKSEGSKGSGKSVQVISSTTIIIIWTNNGGGAPTKTVTETVQAPSATHTVKVGGPGGLIYEPDQLSAQVGDMVIFEFLSQNHTITQSPFDTPCKALEGGMDSGFMANPNNTVVPAPQMAMQVTTDKPLWFYCKQNGHCGKGMVFSINPTADKTQAMFKQMAIAQNGAGAAPPITGGQPAAAPPAAAPPAAPPAAAPAAPPPGMANGEGKQGADGTCTCSCLCGVGSFPNPAVQGRGMIGGWSGAMPMAALEK